MGGRKFRVTDIVFWTIILAIVYMLVRPGSLAGTALVGVTDALAAVVGTATGAEARG